MMNFIRQKNCFNEIVNLNLSLYDWWSERIWDSTRVGRFMILSFLSDLNVRIVLKKYNVNFVKRSNTKHMIMISTAHETKFLRAIISVRDTEKSPRVDPKFYDNFC